MNKDNIIEIGIDLDDQFYIKPKVSSFSDINSQSKDINWNNDLKVIYSPKPGEWSYLMWYCEIIKAAKLQGCILQIDDNTKWVNIDDDLKKDIKILAANQNS